MSAPADEGWVSYFAQIDDELSQIAVDSGLRERAPLANLPMLTRIIVPLIDTSVFGCFFTPEEAEVLDRAVDGLERIVARPIGMRRLLGATPNELRFVGRKTRGRECELYFYSERRIEKRCLVALERHLPGRSWRADDREDRAWDVYLNTLHPGAALNPLLLTRAQIEQRTRDGDDLMASRAVDHALFFRDEEGRKRFVEEIRSLGAEWPVSTFEVSDGERRFGLQCTIEHALARHIVEPYVVALSSRAEPLGGLYDGWGGFRVGRGP